MKRLYLLILIPILIGISFFFFNSKTEEKDFSKIETLINENSVELIKEDNTPKNAEDKKQALAIAAKIQSGECPSSIDEKLKPYAIKKLASNKTDSEKAVGVINCIETLGITQEQHYFLMTDLLAFWEKENPLLELFYTKFFKDYKKSNTKILGLLDNAKLMCVTAAISFLEENKYPANFENVMTQKEYSLFLEYIDEYRCLGYSS